MGVHLILNYPTPLFNKIIVKQKKNFENDLKLAIKKKNLEL